MLFKQDKAEMKRVVRDLAIVAAVAILSGCQGAASSEEATVDGGSNASDGSGQRDAGQNANDGGKTPNLGRVDFVVVYESGSAWEGNVAAQMMVDTLLREFEAALRTSGDWNATVEIYLTDNNSGFANTTFERTFADEMVGNTLLWVVPAWRKIVLGIDNATPPISSDGTGADFTVHFNVGENSDNAGLLRHEIMHGLGAVNSIPNFRMTDTGESSGPAPGTRTRASRYDLQLVDLDGNFLLADYSATDSTFAVQNYRIETSLSEWMDGSGGVFFRGVLEDGDALDMPCRTFPISMSEGSIGLNEPADLMSAAVHPTWDSLGQPDYAFFRGMGYQVVRPQPSF